MYGAVGRSSLCVWGCREVQLMCMEVWGGPAYVYGGVGRSNTLRYVHVQMHCLDVTPDCIPPPPTPSTFSCST